MSDLRRVDAADKVTGKAVFAADVASPGAAFVAFARSEHPSARVVRIDSRSAAAAPGVVAVITAADLPPRTLGRAVRDMPLLAGDRVRFVGERVAAVVAGTRDQAEAAAALVDVGYELEPAVLHIEQALEADAPAVHVAPWDYPGAAIREGDGHNLQSLVEVGSRDAVDAVLVAAEHVVDREYRTPSGHQGYLEPPATLAAPGHGGGVELWTSNKAPYRLRSMLAEALGLPVEAIVVHPVAIGGDFGGKAAPMDAALCALLALRIGRPVRFLPRASEDLIAGNPRHAARVRVRLGCDSSGRLLGGGVDVLFDGGRRSCRGMRAQLGRSRIGLLQARHGRGVDAAGADLGAGGIEWAARFDEGNHLWSWNRRACVRSIAAEGGVPSWSNFRQGCVTVVGSR